MSSFLIARDKPKRGPGFVGWMAFTGIVAFCAAPWLGGEFNVDGALWAFVALVLQAQRRYDAVVIDLLRREVRK